MEIIYEGDPSILTQQNMVQLPSDVCHGVYLTIERAKDLEKLNGVKKKHNILKIDLERHNVCKEDESRIWQMMIEESLITMNL